MSLKITYIYHDCFVVNLPHCSLIFDFWKDPDSKIFQFIDLNKPVYIFVSHHHKDHFNKDIFTWHSNSPIKYILSKDTTKLVSYLLRKNGTYKGKLKVNLENIITLQEGNKYEDTNLKVYAFGSTDIGCSYLIECCGRFIFHAGDLNAWVWKDESEKEEIEQALTEFKNKLSPITDITTTIDIAMFPVDSRIGTDFWEGAKIFVHKFKVEHFIPMHFSLYDNDEEKKLRIEDAMNFDNYKNHNFGKYHSLQEPYTQLELF